MKPKEIESNFNLSGFLLVNKPAGLTSYQVVERIKKITGIKKVGHGGVLDPFATGLLIIGINREATKKLNQILKLDKEYEATIVLGKESDTYDSQGIITERKIEKIPLLDDVLKCLLKFKGEIEQIPPPYSNKKIKGIRARDLIRKGLKVVLKPQKVKIYKINLLEYNFPYLKIRVSCSSGTYIRSLAHDIGEALKTGAYVKELIRTKIGRHSLDKAVSLDLITENNWQKFLRKSL